MRTHETEVRSPGMFPNLVAVHCSCGWTGPTHDVYMLTTRVLVELEAREHRESVCERCENHDPRDRRDHGHWRAMS